MFYLFVYNMKTTPLILVTGTVVAFEDARGKDARGKGWPAGCLAFRV